MYSANHWGGSFDITTDGASEDDDSRNTDVDAGALSARQHHELDETQQVWLLGPPEAKKKGRHVDLGCVVVKRKVLWWAFWGLVAGFVLVGLPIIVYKSIPHRAPLPPPPDQYAEALHKALLFFNAQKCEHRCFPSSAYASYRTPSSWVEFLEEICDLGFVSACADLPLR